MTVSLCTTSCQDGGFKYSGVEYGGECCMSHFLILLHRYYNQGRLMILDCGNAILNGGGPAPDGNKGCGMTCNGNETELCGGPNRMNFYQVDVPPPPPTTGWVAQGCYTDAGLGARTLAFDGIISGGPSAMVNEACYLSCGADGYVYSGTEYSGECCEFCPSFSTAFSGE